MCSRISLTIVVFWCVIESGFSQEMPTATPEEEKPSSTNAAAAIQECRESAPSVFVPVLLTLTVVCAAFVIGFVFWKYYWRIKHGKHLVLVTDVEKGEPEFAFDNPGFREGTPVIQAKKLIDEQEKVVCKESNNVQQISNGLKPQSLDDSAPNKSMGSDGKTNVIPLKSRDFTGLGFSICGNMRDGIYVKDLLHHGPASETGRIKAGDRISAIRINFSHMVHEDAMAILSYASPYEVEVEVEDSSISPESLKNSSMNNHIAHSFYRSQSFSTAQHIQKIIPRKLNFNGSSTKSEPSESFKPAVLPVSEISDKMCKFGGVKVLPDINSQPISVNFVQPITNAEKQQNATIIDVEGDSGIETKTPTNFDEIDLASPGSHQPEKSSLTSTFKDHNMKKVLVKGIQNLKDKLNTHLQKSNEKFPSKENVSEGHKVDTEKPKNDIAVQEDQTCDIDLRLRSNSDSSDVEEMAKKTNKRKAPLPPSVVPSESEKGSSDFNLLNEIENEVNKNNYDSKDSDSEMETDTANNTIELNSSHITVHHVPDESNRKASSLGDLSKITDTDLTAVPLERAVSLELTDHSPRGSKKRKAPMPPEESSDELLYKENKTEVTPNSMLKKSSMFGTLEEAVKQKDDSDDSDHENLLTSTPMKLVDDQFPPADSCSNISWELNFNLQDHSKDDVFLNSDSEKAPDLPTSPIPNLPTYVTEINVSNDNESSSVNSSDVTLFLTAAEASSKENHLSESSTFDVAEIKSLEMTNHEDFRHETELESEGSKDDSSIDTVKEASCNGVTEGSNSDIPEATESQLNKIEPIDQKNSISSNKVFRFSKENMSDEQILTTNTATQPTARRRSSNDTTPTKIKSPVSGTRLPKLSQSISPVRVVGSRIPVRANTEPSLKISSIHKDEILSKTKKFKLSDDAIENCITSNHHLPITAHKTSVLSENRHNGPNR